MPLSNGGQMDLTVYDEVNLAESRKKYLLSLLYSLSELSQLYYTRYSHYTNVKKAYVCYVCNEK